ncbi:alpha/beta hydrolase, partial [Micromonospora phytophila]|nr:alpha/beta hydrolase [Micromonospora phytophila]
MPQNEDIATPRGPARVDTDPPAGPPTALLVLGHGAGGGVDAPDLLALRDATTGAGLVVARVTQPYRVAGRRAPAPAGQLDEAWTA